MNIDITKYLSSSSCDRLIPEYHTPRFQSQNNLASPSFHKGGSLSPSILRHTSQQQQHQQQGASSSPYSPNNPLAGLYSPKFSHNNSAIVLHGQQQSAITPSGQTSPIYGNVGAAVGKEATGNNFGQETSATAQIVTTSNSKIWCTPNFLIEPAEVQLPLAAGEEPPLPIGLDCRANHSRSKVLHRSQYQDYSLVSSAGKGGVANRLGKDWITRVWSLFCQVSF